MMVVVLFIVIGFMVQMIVWFGPYLLMEDVVIIPTSYNVPMLVADNSARPSVFTYFNYVAITVTDGIIRDDGGYDKQHQRTNS